MTADDFTPKVRCSTCKKYFPLTDEYWHKDKRGRGGYSYSCKECSKARARQYGIDNREHVLDQHKKYYVEKKEVIHKPYKRRNAERIAQQKRDWRKRNPDKTKKHKSDSQKRHRPAANARVKKHNTLYPERSRARVLTRIARKKSAEGSYTADDVRRMFEEQNERCAYCGIRLIWNRKRDYHVDHVIPLVRGGTNWPDNLCLACPSCNISKNDHLVSEWEQIRGW